MQTFKTLKEKLVKDTLLTMKSKFVKGIITLLVVLCSQILFSQDISKITTINVDDLSDAQIENVWTQAQQKGYSLEQLAIAAKSKGMPIVQVEKLKSRIHQLGTKTSQRNGKASNKEEDEGDVLFGLTGKEKKEEKEKAESKSNEKELLFGFDFFKNPKISFTPNINVATPQNYQVGPGDVLQIDVWGASEATYKEKVNKQGNISIQGVGLIKLSGLSIEKATSKINSYLKRIYAGINASKNSYQKVYTSVSLSKIRTVQVNMIGEIKVPGTYSLSALSTVLNALYAAGGPTKNGTFREVSLIRKGKRIADFDIYKYLTQGSEKGNLQLQDQDLIIVKPYQNLIVVKGAVKRPGRYELKKGETMADLLDFCGGLTPTVYKNTIVVERVGKKEREIREIPFSQQSSFIMKGGDVITFQEVLDKYKNRVTVSGAVYHPGAYEFTEGMTVLELLDKASGVRKEAYLDRALIIRTKDKLDKETIAFSIPSIYNKEKKILLQPEDDIYIYNKDQLREKRFITVNGAVNKEQKIDFMEGMTVEDAIAMAEGLKEGADPSNIDISRRMKSGSFKDIGKNFTVVSSTNLSMDSKKTPFYLESYDIVSVRYMKGFTKQKKVTIEGEVKYPGDYILTTKDERVSHLIERAGGLSPYAYVEGATIVRKRKGKVEESQQKILNELKQRDSSLVKDITTSKKEFRVGLNLKNILEKKGEYTDLILCEGDKILVPIKKQTVSIEGEVHSPVLIPFKKGKSLSYYIDKAGGFTQTAKKGKTYVIYANGNAGSTSSFLGIKSYPMIKPGATILVPARKPKKGVSAQEVIAIGTGLGTLALLITQLLKK